MNRPNKTPGAGGRRGFQDHAYQGALRELYGMPKRNACMAPFGHEVEAALAAGQHPNVRLYACCDGWELAKSHRHTFGPGTVLLLPLADDPLMYRWPRVRTVLGNVTGLDGMQLQRLARALVDAGCRLAYLLDAEYPERNLRVVAKGWRP